MDIDGANPGSSAEGRPNAVQRDRDRFRAAIEAVQGVLWTNDAEGRMVGEQPGWAALTGQSIADYQGYGWANAIHPDDVEPTIAAWDRVVAERKIFVFEHRVKRHDGAWRTFAIRAVPLLAQTAAQSSNGSASIATSPSSGLRKRGCG